MNEDKMMLLLSNLDDDLIESEIDNLMKGVEYDMDSIKRKAHQKLEQHNRKSRFNKRMPYVAAACACLLFANIVYADEISAALKSLFNQTPVYSTTVQGDAFYLKDRLVLDESLTIESFMVSDGRQDMSLTSTLDIAQIEDIKIVPKDDTSVHYVMGGYSQEGNQYFLSFMNGTDNSYTIKPFKVFDMTVGGKTYTVNLDSSKSFDASQNVVASKETANPISFVTVGANTLEKEGKSTIQLIAAFKDKDMSLDRLGKPSNPIAKSSFENRGSEGSIGSSNSSQTEPLYATDKNGIKFILETPADAKAVPVTSFTTAAPKGSELSVQLPALIASYHKTVEHFSVDIPSSGEKSVDRELDLYAQTAVLKSIKRLSPSSAELIFQLNTGIEKDVEIRSFDLNSDAIDKSTAEFNGNTATILIDFKDTVKTMDFDISWPTFVMNGNWTINLK